MDNIFDYELPEIGSEDFYTHLVSKNVEIKTIISNRVKIPQVFVSEYDEWVVVLKGCAKIEMGGVVYKLKKGESMFIPSNTKHTLLKTRQVVEWLAVCIKEG